MKNLLLLFVFFSGAIGYGQKSPALHVGKKQLTLSSLDVKVNIIGNIATTTYDMVFYNSSSRVLEGQLKFPLAENQEISRLALEMNGKLREAVVVEKELGRIAFEGIVRRGVDPALLEKGKGNTYNVRVYPIPANGSKRVVIAYEQELLYKDNAHYYNLPLDFKERINTFNVYIEVANQKQKPLLVKGEENIQFSSWKNTFKTSLTKKNYLANKSILVKIPVALKTEKIITSPDYFYFYKTLKPRFKERKKPKKITMYWDASLSMKNRNLGKEIEFLDRYFETLKNVDVELVSFSNTVINKEEYKIKNANWTVLKNRISNMIYDGGTSYSFLEKIKDTSDMIMLFSDGLTTLSESSLFKKTPVFIVNSTIEAAHTSLLKIAKKTNGGYVNLNSTSTKEALSIFNTIPLEYLGYSSFTKNIEVYPSVSSKGLFDFSVAGKHYVQGEKVTFFFGYGNDISQEVSVVLDAKNLEKNTRIKRIWAKNKLSELVEKKEENKKQIIKLATNYGLVTDFTSLIVLENIQDYIKYNITPPEELLAEYNRMKSSRDKKRASAFRQSDTSLTTPPPPRPERIEIVEDEKSVEETVIESTETDEMEAVELEDIVEIAEEEYVEEVPFLVVEKLPVFNGCEAVRTKEEQKECFSEKMNQYVEEHFNLSLINNLDVSQGGNKLYAKFTIDRAGKVVDIIVRGQHEILANETVRILQLLPDFIPAKQRGRAVKVSYTLPIVLDTTNQINTRSIVPKNPIVARGNTTRPNTTSVRQNNSISSERKKIPYKKYKGSLIVADRIPKTVYLNALEFFKDEESAYLFYLKQRESYKETIYYYMDVSDYFYRKFKSKVYAERIVSNIPELDADNYELLKAFAYKLEERKKNDLAVFMFKQILELRPEDAQSYRDLALAYQNVGLCQKAFDLFLNIVTKKIYENNKHRRVFEGLQNIAQQELMILYKKYKDDLDFDKIPKKYLTDDSEVVDIRIVVDWNQNDTDIDLHIIDPNLEECYYSHNKTQLGGRISRDMTQGFGPEAFTLKKAKKGFYYIKVKYFGDRKQKIETPTFMKVTIFKNQGRMNEEKIVRIIRLTKEDREEIISKIEF